MDAIDEILTRIITTVSQSKLPETEKNDVYAQLTVGMHRLVWPILLAHVPQYLLDDAVNNPQRFTVEDYAELIDIALKNPATAKEMYEELLGALTEVDALVAKAVS